MSETFKVTPHIAWRRVEEEIVALDLNSSIYYSFNDVGARMWELLAGQQPLSGVAKAIAEEYEAEHAAVAKDLEKFVGDLREEKLLEPA